MPATASAPPIIEFAVGSRSSGTSEVTDAISAGEKNPDAAAATAVNATATGTVRWPVPASAAKAAAAARRTRSLAIIT